MLGSSVLRSKLPSGVGAGVGGAGVGGAGVGGAGVGGAGVGGSGVGGAGVGGSGVGGAGVGGSGVGGAGVGGSGVGGAGVGGAGVGGSGKSPICFLTVSLLHPTVTFTAFNHVEPSGTETYVPARRVALDTVLIIPYVPFSELLAEIS